MSYPTGGNEEKEKRVIEIEEVIDEARVRELAEELAREVVERERAKHKEEVIGMAREVVGEREVFTDRIDRLENEVEVLQGEVVRGQSEVERLLGVVEEQAAQLARAREERRLRQLTNPTSRLEATINATDLFDRYLYEEMYDEYEGEEEMDETKERLAWDKDV